MNRRKFLRTSVGLSAVPLVIATTVVASKPVDKYDDPYYGNTWKTTDSIFTVREIEMFCREWGWHHVEHHTKSYAGLMPQNWVCQAGIGRFIGVDGNEYWTHNTFRTQYDRISPYGEKAKEDFKKFLKTIAGDYYFKGKREHYYFYDVLMPPGDYVHDAYHEWNGKEVKTPSKESLESHGKKYGKVILYHMGVSHGKMWGYIKDKV
jgi:hypothetical protein